MQSPLCSFARCSMLDAVKELFRDVRTLFLKCMINEFWMNDFGAFRCIKERCRCRFSPIFFRSLLQCSLRIGRPLPALEQHINLGESPLSIILTSTRTSVQPSTQASSQPSESLKHKTPYSTFKPSHANMSEENPMPPRLLEEISTGPAHGRLCMPSRRCKNLEHRLPHDL